MKTEIKRATEEDYIAIVAIGRVSVYDAHIASCSEEDMNDYMARSYNYEAVRTELRDPANIYSILYVNEKPAGFSKIVLNAAHPNITLKHTTKLDRIYLLKEYHDLKLGYELLMHNVVFCKANGQAGMWLFTWTGNARAVRFYEKAGFKIVGSHMYRVSANHSNPNHHMLLTW